MTRRIKSIFFFLYYYFYSFYRIGWFSSQVLFIQCLVISVLLILSKIMNSLLLTRSPIFAYNCMIVCDYNDLSTLQKLQQFVALMNDVFQEEDVDIPFNLLRVLLVILHSIYSTFTEYNVSLSDLPAESLHDSILFIKEVLNCCLTLYQVCKWLFLI